MSLNVFGTTPLKIEFAVDHFFFLKLRDLRIESFQNTGRVYFIDKANRIVAVCRQTYQEDLP